MIHMNTFSNSKCISISPDGVIVHKMAIQSYEDSYLEFFVLRSISRFDAARQRKPCLSL